MKNSCKLCITTIVDYNFSTVSFNLNLKVTKSYTKRKKMTFDSISTITKIDIYCSMLIHKNAIGALRRSNNLSTHFSNLPNTKLLFEAIHLSSASTHLQHISLHY